MSNDENGDARHLVRSRPEDASVFAIRTLGSMTGMQRLGFDEIRLARGDETSIGAEGAEWFVYVLTGSGRLESPEGKADVTVGDFVGISSATGLKMVNTSEADLVFLSAGEKGEGEKG